MVYSLTQAGRVREMIANQPGLTEKKMFGGVAFLIGGNMAVGIHGDDLIVRVHPAQTDDLLGQLGAKHFDLGPAGRPPAGWLLVSPNGYKTAAALRVWVERGVAYASSLPKKDLKERAPRK